MFVIKVKPAETNRYFYLARDGGLSGRECALEFYEKKTAKQWTTKVLKSFPASVLRICQE